METLILILFRTSVSTLLTRFQRFRGEKAEYTIATKTALETALTEALLQT